MRTIPEKETLKAAFKSARKDLEEAALIDEVTGMANACGGSIYLGVEGDGTITGVYSNSDDPIDENRIAALVGSMTVPPVPIRVEWMKENGLDVLKLEVSASRSIISTMEGKVLRRRLKTDGSPETVPMRPHEMNTRLSDLGRLDLSAAVFEDASKQDLNPIERQRLRKLIYEQHGEAALLDLDDEELDTALGLQRNGHPTLTGLLLIGKEESLKKFVPTYEAAFQVLEGSSVVINESSNQPILAVFEDFYQRFSALNMEEEFDWKLQRIPVPEFSETAFREAIVNTFAHRDYSRLGRVRVAFEEEGLTISSTGGFVEDISWQNLLTAEPRSRNPMLADALKRIGLAERTGRGIDRIFEGSIQYGRPLPDYSESSSSIVRLLIPRHKPDRGFMNMLLNYQEERSRRIPIYSQLILSVLLQQHRLTLQEMASLTNIGETRLRKYAEQLVEDGMIEASGIGERRSYILSPKVYSSRENLYGSIRQHTADNGSEKMMILQLAQEMRDGISRKDVCSLIKVSPQKAYRMLQELVEEGKLDVKGQGRGTHYVLTGKE